ncbi:DUF4288 domain-containing protein [Thermoflavifilum thermophilum]|uniref:DUF4288 domain-containing protein n=1 Tax=Thermoflavifilum thermophilum TaxID=1393122 RepID=A0A1I7MY41_9BACT|nr:DUF4288 domain-containing protein [Thermoflavifilum thermophilum]SFV27246.1 protein of unknown function [Thermoflavifilum thermophilum]
MKWFIAKLVYQIVIGDGQHKAQFEEQLRLIAASHQHEACRKARQIGKSEEQEFENIHHQIVRWQFLDVSELYPVEEIEDGMELYSHIEEPDFPDSYLKLLKHKSTSIDLDILIQDEEI